MDFWQTFPNSSNYMRLIFHLDCEEHIFNRILRNNYLNQMGLVSLWSRSKNLSCELKLIFSRFWQNFIDRAWIRGCPAHVHQIRQSKQLVTSFLAFEVLFWFYCWGVALLHIMFLGLTIESFVSKTRSLYGEN